MRTALTEMTGCDHPLAAFSHCRDVVAAVTNAGGVGVLGTSRFTPSELDVELRWLDEATCGRPYGIDVLVPVRFHTGLTGDTEIPQTHREFVDTLLARYDVPPLSEADRAAVQARQENPATLLSRLDEMWDVADAHGVKLYASALGPVPPHLIDRAHAGGAVVGGLVGSVRHAERHKAAGADFVVAQGAEAGGHCGEITTMVLVPDVVDHVDGLPVLAAGGIACGRQMAAALALGATGVWTGSVWLTTPEAEVDPQIQQKLVEATASDTIRSRCGTGKYARQLRSAWTDEWERPDTPEPLGLPEQMMLTAEARTRIERAASTVPGAHQLVNYYVGQVVGRMNAVKPARRVVEEMIAEYVDAIDRLDQINSG